MRATLYEEDAVQFKIMFDRCTRLKRGGYSLKTIWAFIKQSKHDDPNLPLFITFVFSKDNFKKFRPPFLLEHSFGND